MIISSAETLLKDPNNQNVINGRIVNGSEYHFTSEVISHELNAITSIDKRERVLSLLSLSREHITLTPDIVRSARTLWQNGVDAYDALHYACALSAGAAFVTVDDALIKKIMSLPGDQVYTAFNPVPWFMEHDHE